MSAPAEKARPTHHAGDIEVAFRIAQRADKFLKELLR
jgi:hypothetical protein